MSSGSDADNHGDAEDDQLYPASELVEFVQELRDEGKLPKNSSFGNSKPFKGNPNAPISSNTGPKGVIQDYKMAKAEAARKMEAERLNWEEKMRNLGGPLLDSSSKTDQPKDEDSDFDLDNEEEEFLMQALKQQQLKQFQMMSSAERQDKIIQEKKKINQKYFGSVTQLTQETFVPFIDAEDPSTIVIIHLYQTYFAACMKLNGILNSLARKYNTYKFGKIISTVAKPGFNDNGLACLIVYQGGDLKHSFVRVQDEVCKGFDFDDIENFLIENAAINPGDAAKDWDE